MTAPYAAQPAAPKNTMALWALGLGIVSIILVISNAFAAIAFVPGIAAIVLSIIALRREKTNEYERSRKGMAIVSLIFGILATLAAVLVLIFVIPIYQACGHLSDEAAIEQCLEDHLVG